MVTIEELTWAYRIFLAREPEDAHISAISRPRDKDLPGIRKEFMTSFEYASPICLQKRQGIGVTPELIKWACRLVLLKDVPEKLTQSWPNLDDLIIDLAEEYRATNRSIPSNLSINSKIVILGNCQSGPLETLLRHRGGVKHIKSYLEHSLNKETLNDADLREIESADLIISQPLLSESFGPLETKKLTGSRKNVLIIPNLYFTGMHPELVYVGSSKNRLKSQLDEYHSAIAIAAFFAGLSVKETISLYRSREFFEDCGFFDEWQESLREYLLREYVCDISLFKYLQGKAKRDLMFYTVNHPALPLLAQLASAILELFDIQPNWQTAIRDEFKFLVIYPVWTPLVGYYGLGFQNNDNFYVKNRPISLEKYLNLTFKDYRERTPLGVRSPEKLARIEKSIKKRFNIKQDEAILTEDSLIERMKKGLRRLIVKSK